ncbi:MAG: hypothetical protein BWZ01_00247 [Deltaproteobacteria bacterium ADurb.BinA179]|jgi:hypothetical protein|nr:MAG: hypothetical protein BWZ01_00247 [Deltaproteobacteria bacterium ADurb.BinA179]HNR52327.1 hypothetical protein [Deltaproteobacteria bacterium]HRR68784.1 hypothetical protein [Desulfomonilia bacterium]HOD70112.1 hypothetical protein [Deltaproteobacteria bacterium]HOE71827.1 hypothetical protein [Deltaproteobacteria bacterium]
MGNGHDILEKLIVVENGKVKVMRTIEDIENLLERLTRIQDTYRSQRDTQGRKIKDEVDHLIRIIASLASIVYTRELQRAQ